MNLITHSFSQNLISLRKTIFSLIFCITVFFQGNHVNAQEVTAKATVDTNAILIGSQLVLSLSVTHPSGLQINWPAVPDTFALFELVQQVNGDTVINSKNNTVTGNRHYKITSFDSGYHVIPPFEFLFNTGNKSSIQKASTDPILIHVQTIPVDTTKSIRDIKGQVVIPFTWRDAVPYLLGILAVALVIFLVYYFVKRRKPAIHTPVFQVPKRPAHEIALESLKHLEDAKLWQQGNYKGYHTALSDITRMFIQNRWSVAAMEMTTDEILRLQIISGQDPVIYSQLKVMLELADLVKFAKLIPVGPENEISMSFAVAFVTANKSQTENREVSHV